MPLNGLFPLAVSFAQQVVFVFLALFSSLALVVAAVIIVFYITIIVCFFFKLGLFFYAESAPTLERQNRYQP